MQRFHGLRFFKINRRLNMRGIDISDYAILIRFTGKKFIISSKRKKLEFEDKSFDYVISINTV